MAKISIQRLLEINDEKSNPLKLRLVNNVGLSNKISTYDVNRPGMVLFDYFEHFSFDRIQLLGMGEASYVCEMYKNNNSSTIDKIFEYNIPVFLFSNDITPPDDFINKSTEHEVPIIISELNTSRIVHALINLLEDEFADTTVVHGVFIDVLGVGILIKGSSGVGKSEATLELISKGHRLVADDSVHLKKLSDGLVIGRTHKDLAHYMEVRGIGIVDISRIAGMSGVRDRKRLDLVIELSYWSEQDNDVYDRTGLNDIKESVLGVEIPYLKIPVKSGRTLSTLIETAAKNHRLKEMGYNSAKEFNKRMIEALQKGKADNNS